MSEDLDAPGPERAVADGSAAAPEPDDAPAEERAAQGAEEARIAARKRRKRAARHRAKPRPGRPSQFSFVIAGIQKAGTTSLYAMLSEHEQIAPARVKELHFFDDESVNWDKAPYYAYHRKIVVKETATIAGEATPRYIFWPGAMERLQEYNPQMQIILSFRDPIERAFSHWSMSRERANYNRDFSEAVERGHDVGWPRPASFYKSNTARTMLSRGFYGRQLEHALGLFPREQFLLLDYHDLFRDLDATLAKIASFLGVDSFPPRTEGAARLNTASPELVGAPPTPDDIARMAALYQADLALFAELSGFDVSAWPTSRVASGDLDPTEVAAKLAAKLRSSPAPAPAAEGEWVPEDDVAGDDTPEEAPTGVWQADNGSDDAPETVGDQRIP